MSVLSTKTKTKVGVKTAKQAAKHPKLAFRGVKAANAGKRAIPPIAVGVAAGAAAMYFLDPASGDERRRRLFGLITPTGRSGDPQDGPHADDEAGGPAHPAPGHMPPEQP
jgi:hypothetical protein